MTAFLHRHLFWDQNKSPEISCEHVQPPSPSTLSTAENIRRDRLKSQFIACSVGIALAARFKVQRDIGMRSVGTGMLVGWHQGLMH